MNSFDKDDIQQAIREATAKCKVWRGSAARSTALGTRAERLHSHERRQPKQV